jgi:transcriptional regulator with XRE-family HTH domain
MNDRPAALMREHRATAGLSQAEAASRAAVDQPMLSRYENGRRDPSWDTLRRLLRAVDVEVELRTEPMPTAPGVRTLTEMAEALMSERTDSRRLRNVLDFVTRYGSLPPSLRGALLLAAPPLTGDERWDAMLAAVAEHLAFHDEIDPPSWSLDADRFLPVPWYVVDLPSVRRRVRLGAPTAFRRRNVWLDRSDLVRI